MASGVDEVKAAVHAIVDNVTPIQATLVLQVLLELTVNVLDDLFETTTKTQATSSTNTRQHNNAGTNQLTANNM